MDKILKGFNMNNLVQKAGKQVVKINYNPEGVKQNLLSPFRILQ